MAQAEGRWTVPLLIVLTVVALITVLEVKTGILRGLTSIAQFEVTERLRRIPFDPVQWKINALVYGNDPIRLRMIDNLLDSRRLIGLSRGQVIALLGKPDDTSGTGDLSYYLGRGKDWLGMDTYYLCLRMSRSGRIVQAECIALG